MKKMFFALMTMLTLSVTASAMSYEQARNEALFLTDKMAYELNLTDEQYEAAYEINLDYLMGVTGRNDVFGTYWERRNLDLSYVLLDWQWSAFIAATYFYRPLYWEAGYWHFGIYRYYPRRDYFFFGRPHFYATYRGGHAWHVHDRWNRGDFRGARNSSTRITGNHDSRRRLEGNRTYDNSNRRYDGNRNYDGNRRYDGNRNNGGDVNRNSGGGYSGGGNFSGGRDRSSSISRFEGNVNTQRNQSFGQNRSIVATAHSAEPAAVAHSEVVLTAVAVHSGVAHTVVAALSEAALTVAEAHTDMAEDLADADKLRAPARALRHSSSAVLMMPCPTASTFFPGNVSRT